ncbi:hypothetical protein JW935_17905 [candidate division KSB1 bacterium]|nr:hypothetical protein [candidate division KSB1 bacterium]
MKIQAVVFLLLCFSPFSAGALPYCQVLHADELKAAGIGRLSDVFPLFFDWSFWTVDGFRVYTSTRLFNPGTQRYWVCYIDGQRMDDFFAGDYSINLLPLNVDQIDSIKVASQPAFINSDFSAHGIIEIFTKNPEPGFYLSAKYYHGNEAGDPGPYIYTSQKSENVDQQGPDYSTSFGWTGKRFRLMTGAATLRHTSTDSEILSRHRNRPWELLRPQASIWYATLGYQGERWHHLMHVGQGASGAPWLIEEYGAELSHAIYADCEVFVESCYRHLGLSGCRTGRNGNQTTYHLKLASSRTAKPVNYDGLDFDWNLHSITGHLLTEHRIITFPAALGYSFRRHILHSRFAPLKPVYGSDFIYTRLNIPLFHLSSPVEFGMRFLDNKPTFQVKTGLEWQFNRRHRASLHASDCSNNTEENDLLFWLYNGYRPSGFENFVDLDQNRYHLTTIGLEYFYSSDSPLKVTTGMTWQRLRNFPKGWSKNSDGFYSISLMMFYRFHRIFCSHIYCSFLDSDFSGQKFLGKYQVKMLNYFTPVENFSVFMMLTYLSRTNWSAFFNPDVAPNFFYYSLPAQFTADLTLKKWLWKRRIGASFILRNLLNRPVQTFPRGANFNLSLYVLAEFNL